MTAVLDESALLEPISADAPCGKSIEDTDTFASLDAYQIFGQITLEPPKQQSGEPAPARKEARKSDRPPAWEEILDEATSALGTSKDLRILAYVGASILRIGGISAFAQVLGVASHWLAVYPTQVFPLVDEDALFRQNALNCFADPVAVIDALRRAPLVSHRQHGRFSIRDFDLLSGELQPGQNEAKPDSNLVDAAFNAVALDELKALQASVESALKAVSSIDSAMREANGSEFAPSYDSLSTQFKKMAGVVRTKIAARSDVAPETVAEGETPGETGSAVRAVGAIRSRDDAIRALDAVSEFFKRNEPSSPIPLFIERAKRLVSKDFLEVLADVAPDALSQARSAGGLRDE